MPTESKLYTTPGSALSKHPWKLSLVLSYYSRAESDLRLLRSKCISLCAALPIVNARLRCREVPINYTCKSPAARSALGLRVFFVAPSAYNSAVAKSSLLWMTPRRYPALSRVIPANNWRGSSFEVAPG
jgi:hypothetical protein